MFNKFWRVRPIINELEVLRCGVDSLSPWYQANGLLHDPVFDAPTQYGTAYYAFCNAVMAKKMGEPERKIYLERAVRGLQSALEYVADPTIPVYLSSFKRETGEAWGINHRDFFWPAILKTYRLLREIAPQLSGDFGHLIASVDILKSFSARPPSNWSMVWLSGEWIRIQEGLSPYSMEQFDRWLEPFFQTHIDMSLGFYLEPGLPNSYDLFTRYHLADVLSEEYTGRWKKSLEQLMETGLARSLAVQLSDGSLASGYRSTGQTWTLGIQCAYFTLAARFFNQRRPDLAHKAREAAYRALTAMTRWQRSDGPYSPVENCLPPAYRVGYELYTGDGHYSPLALAFLAAAVNLGFSINESSLLVPREPAIWIEHDPTYRVIAHAGDYSLHVNTYPTPEYDAFGNVDVTFGPNRFFHFASSVRNLESGKYYNLGMATREKAGRSAVSPLAQMSHALSTPIEQDATGGFHFRTRPKGSSYPFEYAARVTPQEIWIQEALPGKLGYQSLLVPYLRDGGRGLSTRIVTRQGGVDFHHGQEIVLLDFDLPVDFILDLPYGFENRRGLCGLLRIDFRDRVDTIEFRLRVKQ
jgi:hypothetical protein